MRIGILLSGRYPTEKAYGVTTNSTIKSLSNMGHSVYVLGLRSNYSKDVPVVENFSILEYKELRITKFIKAHAFAGHGILSQLSWWIYWRILEISNKSMLRELNLDLIWIRDPQMIRFTTHARKVILEIHQDFDLDKLTKRITARPEKKFIIAPISQSLMKRFEGSQLEEKTIFSPMGINLEDISDSEGALESLDLLMCAIRDQARPLKVGYVGKFYPNGYSKGIEDLLGLTSKADIKNIPLEISLTGGTESEIDFVSKYIRKFGLDQTRLHLFEHVPHSLALDVMRNLDVIVLPSPNSAKYLGFPLKCLEAVATGKIVVVSRTKIYEDVFNEYFQPYWYTPGDIDSLHRCIEGAISDPNLSSKILEGLDFSKGFTWINRTDRLMKAFEGRS
jgi:glycosyltransferase involved in cell wall biosynthesis